MTKIIEVDHVTKRFKNKLALNDVSFSIDAGKIYGFRGPNGSGKSVTFKTVLGFIRPNSGTVKVLGKKIRQDVIFARTPASRFLNTACWKTKPAWKTSTCSKS